MEDSVRRLISTRGSGPFLESTVIRMNMAHRGQEVLEIMRIYMEMVAVVDYIRFGSHDFSAGGRRLQRAS